MTKRIFVVIVGLLLMACGILSLNAQLDNFHPVTNITGALMVVTGLVNIILFVKIKDFPGSSAWILIEGILVSLLGIFLLLSEDVLAMYMPMLPIFYAVWLLVSGVVRFIKSFDFKNYGITSWWIMLINGIISILLAGVLFLSEYVIAFAAIGVMISGIYIMRGILEVILGITMEMEN